MELKMKYHYSYFIYPYVVKEEKYNKYIQELLKNEQCKLKLFERRKNFGMYNYFLPTVREYMFKSFGFTENNIRAFNTMGINMRANMLSSIPCTIFEYDVGHDIQAKAGDIDGIFFRIQRIEIICFNTGICFLTIKTNIEDTDKLGDLLNFNYTFRDANSEVEGGMSFNKIKIQTNAFSDIKRLSELIKELTGEPIDAQKIDINTNRFLIYSYVCIDQQNWDESHEFKGIEKEFFKFANVLRSEYNSSYNNEKLKMINLGDYIKVGVSGAGVNLITSSINTVNYTNLPYEFENEYFYTYIFMLYKKLYLTKLLNEFNSSKNTAQIKKKFIDFTDKIWIHEITNNDNGNFIGEEASKALELDKLYEKAKMQYDIAYKNLKIKDTEKANKILLILLAISIIANVFSFSRWG